MKQTLTKGALWNRAGAAGLVLGLVSTAYMFITQYMTGISSAFLQTLMTFLLWALKFGGCIWLMKYFMKRFAEGFEGADNSATMRFGMAAAACSALVYSTMTLANVLIISPDLYSTALDTVMQSYSSILDSNSASMLEKMWDRLPQITFFSNLIYCFIYGTVVSAILSRNIPARDPFAGFGQTGENKVQE